MIERSRTSIHFLSFQNSWTYYVEQDTSWNWIFILAITTFGSRKETNGKECLPLIKDTTVIHSDHKNLTYFRSAQKLNCWQARWSLYLSKFDLQLIHVPGNKMIVSNALSYRADHCSGNEHNNKDITLLLDRLFVNSIDSEPILHVLINLIDTELQEKIANSKDLDTSAAKALKLLLKDQILFKTT